MFGNWFLVVSNVAYLFPAYACFLYGKYFGTFIFTLIFSVSSAYHLCKWGYEDELAWEGYCIFETTYEKFYFWDFFFSQLSIVVSVCYFINPKKKMSNVHVVFKNITKNHKCYNMSNLNGQSHNLYAVDFEKSIGNNTYDTINQGNMTVAFEEDTDMIKRKKKFDVYCYNKIKLNFNITCNICSDIIYTSNDVKKNYSNENITKMNNTHSLLYTSGTFYVNTNKQLNNHLLKLEIMYVLLHSFVLYLSISIVGTSFYYVTIPLVVINTLILTILIISSHLVDVRYQLLHTYIYNERHNSMENFCKKSIRPDWSKGLECFLSWFIFENLYNYPNILFKIYKLLPKNNILKCNIIKSTEWSFNFSNRDVGIIIKAKKNRKKIWGYISIFMGVIALILFFTQYVNNGNEYYWMHSTWHILGGLSFYIKFTILM